MCVCVSPASQSLRFRNSLKCPGKRKPKLTERNFMIVFLTALNFPTPSFAAVRRLHRHRLNADCTADEHVTFMAFSCLPRNTLLDGCSIFAPFQPRMSQHPSRWCLGKRQTVLVEKKSGGKSEENILYLNRTNISLSFFSLETETPCSCDPSQPANQRGDGRVAVTN